MLNLMSTIPPRAFSVKLLCDYQHVLVPRVTSLPTFKTSRFLLNCMRPLLAHLSSSQLSSGQLHGSATSPAIDHEGAFFSIIQIINKGAPQDRTQHSLQCILLITGLQRDFAPLTSRSTYSPFSSHLTICSSSQHFNSFSVGIL